MVMSMEYFKKIQCYKPSIGIIDAPVNIEEVALLQDSVDKNILGRIKFINYSKQSIIAIFVQLRVLILQVSQLHWIRNGLFIKI